MSSAVAAAVAAVEADEVVVLPTDTVYGLVATAYRPVGRDAVYRLKGRDYRQPSALMAASLEVLFECVPELLGRSGEMASALLPGPYTLVLPNPAGRLPWLCGDDPTSIGVRVPELVGPGGSVLTAVGAVVATSANLPGGPEPRSVEEVPEALRRPSQSSSTGRAARSAVDRARSHGHEAVHSARRRRRRCVRAGTSRSPRLNSHNHYSTATVRLTHSP